MKPTALLRAATIPASRSLALLLVAALASCGGGDDPPVELEIDPHVKVLIGNVILTGSSFVPAGSNCPPSSEFIRIGTLGLNTITYTNTATGITGPVFNDLWICNSAGGRKMYWTSNPITVIPGNNPITVRMVAGSRSSAATVTVQGK